MATLHSRRSRIAVELACALSIVLGSIPAGIGHELESDRLTIVMREPGHLALAFRVDEMTLLRRLLASDATDIDFLISMAAMDDTTFDDLVDRGRARFESQVVIVDQNASELLLRNWRWTSKDQLRRKIHELAMATVVSGDVHTHNAGNEITVDAVSSSPVSGITLRLPKGAAKILVVAYRPQQSDYDPGHDTALVIGF